jgi:hypothetical protein
MSDTSAEDQSWWGDTVEAVEQAYDATVETVEQTYDAVVETGQEAYEWGAESAEQASSWGASGVESAADSLFSDPSTAPARAETGVAANAQAAADHAAAQAGVGVDPASPAWGDRTQKWVTVVAVGQKALNVITISLLPGTDGDTATLMSETDLDARNSALATLQQRAAEAGAAVEYDTPPGYPPPSIDGLTEPVFTSLIPAGEEVVVSSTSDDPDTPGFKVQQLNLQAQYQAEAYLMYTTTVRA